MERSTILPKERMTNKQVDQVAAAFRAKLKENQSAFESEAVNLVSGGLLLEPLLETFRDRVEHYSTMFTRNIEGLNHQEVFQRILSRYENGNKGGRQEYTNDINTAASSDMPRPNFESAEVVFFSLVPRTWHLPIDDEQLDEEYRLRGLKPADPFSLFAVNLAEPDFSDRRISATHWKNANGRWCFVMFGDNSLCTRKNRKRFVTLDFQDGNWEVFDKPFFFAGFRK